MQYLWHNENLVLCHQHTQPYTYTAAYIYMKQSFFQGDPLTKLPNPKLIPTFTHCNASAPQCPHFLTTRTHNKTIRVWPLTNLKNPYFVHMDKTRGYNSFLEKADVSCFSPLFATMVLHMHRCAFDCDRTKMSVYFKNPMVLSTCCITWIWTWILELFG